MQYIVFQNFESGTRMFGYYDDESEAREYYEELVEHYRKTKVAIEVGYAEIQMVTTMNWDM